MDDRHWTSAPTLAVLAGKEEDRFTEYLCHLLRDGGFLAAFTEKIGLDYADTLTVSTQVRVQGGRPDLVIRNEDNLVLFEAKLGSWLHDDQVVPYARRVVKARNDGRRANLWLITPAVAETGLLETGAEQLATAGISEVELAALTSEAIGALASAHSESLPPGRLRTHLEDFASLVRQRLGDDHTPFSSEEAAALGDPLVARALVRVRTVVDAISRALKSRDKTIRISRSRGVGFDGLTLTRAGRYWWVGLWVDAWASAGTSPVQLQLYGLAEGDETVFPGLLPHVRYTAATSNGRCVPLRIPEGLSPQEVALLHADVIQAYLKHPKSGREA